ncbi:MAG: sigma-54 dependent transcriptional regulator, partial [Proteobacteria bacterium]|nr:sigma-54 dependent transcriptional regulator [Pseudomonadota bacterium]
MISYSICIVDDEQVIREGIALAFESDYQVNAFPAAETAIEAIKNSPPDLILLDIGLPGINGIQALSEIKKLCPEIPVIMITAYEDIKTVTSAMKLGAYDYVVKPIHMDELAIIISNALETIRLRKEVKALQDKYFKETLPCFIGESNAIQDVVEFIETVAKSPDTPILILGETGTGKELIASAIHARSPNFNGPLITVNCAAIPKELIESELFGYEKGGFSGASISGKKGLIEESENGTLFLDEVGDLSLDAQAKLLRFLEYGEFYRIGGTKKLKIKTRIVSATNKDINKLIDNRLLRKDLYFRLGVIKVQIPSLNERRKDIIPLAKHFLYEFSKKFHKTFTGIAPEAEKVLKEYNWVGNVRELKNLIERGVVIGKGLKLTLQDLGIEGFNSREIARSDSNMPCFPPITPAGIDLPSVQKS